MLLLHRTLSTIGEEEAGDLPHVRAEKGFHLLENLPALLVRLVGTQQDPAPWYAAVDIAHEIHQVGG